MKKIIGLVLLFTSSVVFADVNVYSARKEKLIKPLLDQFAQQTGVKVNLVTGKADALLARLKSEGNLTPADILITTDAGRLHRAKEAGFLSTLNLDILGKKVPTNYRDKDNQWVGLSLRSRPIVYRKGSVNPAMLSTYEALADPKYKGRICIRSSGNIYNQSLIASMIAAKGEAATLDWAKKFVKNLARPPKGGDRDQIKAVANGECDIAIVNTYYLAGMLKSKSAEQVEAAQTIGVFWPNQDDRGAHVNVSGAGIIKSSKNKAVSLKLIEFLTSDEAQKWYAEANQEYPIRGGIQASKTLNDWGVFKADDLNLSQLGDLNAQAVRLMDKAGWK